MTKLERIDSQTQGTTAAHKETAERPMVLYVEDEDPNWELAEFNLRDKYQIMRASNATEACDLIKKHDFQIILMDIQLSGSSMNGIELTKALRGITSGSTRAPFSQVRFRRPIIFVSAYTARYRKDELQAAGGDDLIAKPVNFTGLSLAISRCLARAVLRPEGSDAAVKGEVKNV